MADYGIEHIRALAARGHSFMVKAQKAKEFGKATARRGAGFGLTCLGGLASGVYSGRLPNTTLFGVPFDLLGALLLGGAGVFGALGPGMESELLANFGGGLGSGFLARFGAGIGNRWRLKQPLFGPATTTTSGALPPTRYAPPLPPHVRARVDAFHRSVANMPL